MIILACNINELVQWQFQILFPFVDEEKQKEIENYYKEDDKYRSLISRLLVYILMRDNFKIENDKIIFKKNLYGKPYLYKNENFKFNISHSGNWVVCGADYSELGIDVQEKIKETQDIAKYCLTDRELEFYRNMDEKSKDNTFHAKWTIKESYIKFIGKGLGLGMNTFDIDTNLSQVHFAQRNEVCYFKEYYIDTEYKLFVCSQEKRFPKEVIFITIEEILNRFITIK